MPIPLRVLIVEDSENDALLLAGELRRKGYEPEFERVDTAESLRTALQKSYWDIVLADFSLPRFSGMDALNIVKETGADIPFILVSGSVGEELAVEAMKAGANDYIMKNNLPRLAPAVERELREAEVRRLKLKAEQALKETNQTLWALIKSSPLAIVSVDTQRRVTMWNPAADRLFGWTEKEVLGTVLPIVPKDRHPEFRDILAHALEGKSMTICETQRKRKDGALVDVSITSAPLNDSRGGILGAMAVFSDITERKQTESTLRQSEMKFRALTETTAAAIFIYQGTKMRYVNRAAEQMVGYSREEFLRMDYWEIIHPDFQELVRQQGSARQRGENISPRYEVKLKTKTGQERWVDFTAGVIEFEGKPAVLGTAIDITERKQMEERYRSIFENAAEGIFVTTPEGQMLTANPALARMLGYASPEELLRSAIDIGKQLYVDSGRREDLLRELHSKKEARGFDCELYRKDGRKIWISANVRAVQNEQGHIIRLEGVAQDITERKQAEEALRKNEALLRKTQQIARLGGWELDLSNLDDIEKNDLCWTEETFRIFGYAPGEVEVTNELFFEHVHPEDRPKVDEAVSRALAEKTSYSIEHRILLRDKTERIVHERGDILFEEKTGRPLRMYGTVQDITEKKRLESQLHQVQKMEAVGQLAGGIAHDFNNLLTAIDGYSGLVLERVAPENPLRSDLEEIKKATGRAAALTRQLLAFSRRQIMQPAIVNLNDLAANMEKMLRRLIGENIELATHCAPDLAPVKADPNQLEQVIMNLAVNARDAMPDGGRLLIETANTELDAAFVKKNLGSRAGSYVLLSVSDTGSGMDAETQKHIFEPFFTTKEKGQGTGLGLSTVYGIVKQSGGYISVYSEPGQGSCFKVYLPRTEGEVQPTAVTAAGSEPVNGNEIILIVEDEDAVRSLAAKILRAKGYSVLEAEDGNKALNILARWEGPLHLLLSDVVMPRMGGVELARQLQAARPELKVLLMSGYSDHSVFHEGELAAGTAFLQKPFTQSGLAQKVREILDREKVPPSPSNKHGKKQNISGDK